MNTVVTHVSASSTLKLISATLAGSKAPADTDRSWALSCEDAYLQQDQRLSSTRWQCLWRCLFRADMGGPEHLVSRFMNVFMATNDYQRQRQGDSVLVMVELVLFIIIPAIVS